MIHESLSESPRSAAEHEGASPPPLPRRAVAPVDSIPPGEPQDRPGAIPPPLPRRSHDAAPAGSERRTAERAELRADVSLYSETNFWSGFTEDLSEGGLFVATYELLPIGTRMELVFELPSGAEVRTSAEVRWHRAARQGSDTMPGMGFSFLNLSQSDLATIRAFVKHRDPLLWDED